MQAGVGQVIAFTGRADGADVADVLDHGGQSQGDDGDHGADQQAGVAVAEQGEHGAFHFNGRADPSGLFHQGEVHVAGNSGHHIGGDNAQQDGDDLDHTLAPDVADDDHDDGHQSDGPVLGAVVQGAGGQGQADADDDGAGDDGREEPHDLLCAEGTEEGGQDDIQQASDGDASAGIGQQFCLTLGGDGLIASQEGEGRAQEGGHFALGQQVKQQGAQAGEQQGGGDAQAGQNGDQDGSAEHGEHMLDAQHQHSRCAQRSGIIDALCPNDGFFFTHDFLLLSFVSIPLFVAHRDDGLCYIIQESVSSRLQMVTLFSPSISATFTETISRRAVGMCLPT